MMSSLTVNISYPNKVKAKLHNYSVALNEAKRNALREISGKIQDKLLENMIKYGVDSTEILGSIEFHADDEGIDIRIGCDYAMFVEFGTGVVGSENPHPNPAKAGWIYGDSGWWYPTTADKQKRYPHQRTTLINGQLYAYTEGQASKPFVYDTWLWASRSVNNIFRKHLRGIKID